MDLDLRKLRYFVTVAEELNFGRAAERLFVAQPALSRQVSALESELEVKLFKRSKRGTELTEAGAKLLDDASSLLNRAAEVQRRVRIAARGRTRFRIGCLPGMNVANLIRRMGDQFPDITVEIVTTAWYSQTEVVRDGQVDVSVVRLPVRETGLTLLPLYSEPCVVALSSADALTKRPRVSLAEIARLNLLQPRGAFPQWSAAAALATELAAATGQLEREAPHFEPPVYEAIEELFTDIAAGRGIALMPESAAQFYNRPDVAYRYVDGHAPIEVALAYGAGQLSPMLQALVEHASMTLSILPSAPGQRTDAPTRTDRIDVGDP